MKSRHFLLFSVASLASTGITHAAVQNFAWDAGRTSWNGSFWKNPPATSYTNLWGGYNDAVFEAPSGTVSITGTQSLNSLTFSASNFILDGGSLNFGNPVGGAYISVASGSTATLNTTFGTNSSGLAKKGAGTLKLTSSGNSSATPLLINDGTFELTNGGLATSTSSVVVGNGAAATLNLTGGTLTAIGIAKGSANGILNFDGGTLKAGAASTTFLTGLTAANIKVGGANINTNNVNITIGQPLLDGTGGGGLTKTGAGTLTLSGTSTYTGTTTVSQGILNITGSLASTAFNIGVDYGASDPSATGLLTFASSQNLDGKTLSSHTSSGTAASTTAYLRPILSLTGGSTGTLTITAPSVTDQSIIRAGNFYFLTNSVQASYLWNSAADGSAISDGPGTWDTSSTSWRKTDAMTTNAAWTGGSNIAYFGVNNAAAGTVTVSGTVSAGGLSFNPAASGTYTLSGGTIDFGASNAAIYTNSTDATIASILTGTNGLTKSGTGTITLSGATGYTGTTTVTAGTLRFATQLALYNNTPASWTASNLVVNSGTTAAFNVGGSGEFTASDITTLKGLGTASGGFKTGAFLGLDTTNASDGSFTYATAIANPNGGSNTLGLVKLGSGTLALPVANTYTGGTTLTGGTLSFASGALGSTGAIGMNGGTLQWNAANTQDVSARIAMQAGKTAIFDTGGNNVTLATAFGSATNAALVKNGAGTLTLTGQCNFSGGATVNTGTLVLQRPSTGTYISGAMVVNSGATLTFNNNTGTTLDGWAGGLTINGGTASTIGSNSVWYSSLDMTGGTFTANCNFYGMSVTTHAAATTATISGGTAPYNGTNYSFAVARGSAATDVSVSTPLGGNGGLTKSGAGILVLTGANSYSAGTTLSDGTLAFNSGSLGNTGAISMSGGTLQWNGTNTQDVSSRIAMQTGKTATFDTKSNNVTFASAIGSATNAAMTKTGAGTLNLTAANTYTGTTTVNAGTLTISGAGSIAASPVINVATNATLQGGTFGSGQSVQGTGNLAGTLTIGTGAILSPAGDATTGTMDVTGTLVLGGAVHMQIQKSAGSLSGDQFTGIGAVTYGGTLVVSASGETLALNDTIQLFANAGGFNSSNFASVSLPVLPAGLAWNYGNLNIDGTITVSNALSSPLFSPAGGGYLGAKTVTITADSGSTIFYTINGGDPNNFSPNAASPVTGLTVPVDDTTTIKAFSRKPGFPDSPVATATYVTVSTARWNEDNNGLWSEASKWLAQAIPDASGAPVDFYSFHQSGATAITLDSNRTAGSITFGNDEPTDWTLNATNGSILTLAGTTTPAITVQPDISTTISAPIAGTQGLTKLGAGTLTLTGQSTFSGGATVNAGTLILQRPGTGGYVTGPMVVNSGATLTFNNNSGTTLDGWGSDLTIHGGTASTIGSTAVWYGSLNMTGGSFNANCNFYGMNVTTHAAATTATITGGIAPYNVNYTFAVEDGTAPTDLSVSTPLGGTATLTKTGAGTLILSGASTYTGASAINAGTLLVTGSTHASSALSIAASATLGGTGTANGTVTAAGTIAPGTTGTGTLATGAATLTGSYSCQINGAVADRWNVSGNLNLTNATLAVSEITPASFTSVVIAKYTGTLTGTFTPSPALPTGVTLQYDATAKEIRLTTAGDFGSWLAGFTFALGADTTPTGDADGDGLTNQQEYAFGLDPSQGSSVNPITNLLDKANATFTYVRRKPSLTKLTYKVWTSTNLGLWTEDTGAQQAATDQADNQSVLVTLSAPAPLTASQLFIRCTAE